jgi:S-adenosylmethionine:tRNA ribosyltransferase-isomerase
VIAAATWPREHPEEERLLHVDPARGRFTDVRVADLPERLAPGDLLVVNDAATLPASLRALRSDGGVLEVRLLAHEGGTRWRAILFGRGDWRTRTEERPTPPRLDEGEPLRLGGAVSARVLEVDERTPRLVRLAFEGGADAMWRAIYEEGRPVQYAYLAAPLDLWHVQSPFASRPWSVELPSAGRPLTFGVLARLAARGVAIASLTHAAGLSSSGDPELDARLPLAERYEIPASTADAVVRARTRPGARVIAVGTTVVRALEGCAQAHGGELVGGAGVTDLRVGPRSKLRVVDGLLTGIHERGTSHYDLMAAFFPASAPTSADHAGGARAGAGLLDRALEYAEAAGYLQHEFGDSVLVLRGRGAT